MYKNRYLRMNDYLNLLREILTKLYILKTLKKKKIINEYE